MSRDHERHDRAETAQAHGIDSVCLGLSGLRPELRICGRRFDSSRGDSALRGSTRHEEPRSGKLVRFSAPDPVTASSISAAAPHCSRREPSICPNPAGRRRGVAGCRRPGQVATSAIPAYAVRRPKPERMSHARSALSRFARVRAVSAQPGPVTSVRTAVVCGTAAALVQVAVVVPFLGRYGWDRDELYFLSASRRPTWGYVDFPPITAWVAWLVRQPFDDSLVALRITCLGLAMLTVVLVALMARELGGSAFVQLGGGPRLGAEPVRARRRQHLPPHLARPPLLGDAPLRGPPRAEPGRAALVAGSRSGRRSRTEREVHARVSARRHARGAGDDELGTCGAPDSLALARARAGARPRPPEPRLAGAALVAEPRVRAESERQDRERHAARDLHRGAAVPGRRHRRRGDRRGVALAAAATAHARPRPAARHAPVPLRARARLLPASGRLRRGRRGSCLGRGVAASRQPLEARRARAARRSCRPSFSRSPSPSYCRSVPPRRW